MNPRSTQADAGGQDYGDYMERNGPKKRIEDESKG
jgi:hypothetical protein